MVTIQQILVSKDVQMVATEMLILQTVSVFQLVLGQPLLTISQCCVLTFVPQILQRSDTEATGPVCKPALENSGQTVLLEHVSPHVEVTLD
jgi:hypothetical protein